MLPESAPHRIPTTFRTAPQELALAFSNDRQPHESKAFAAPGDEIQPKSND